MIDPGDLDDVAERAVRKTFTALGVDISTPEAIISAQQDFAFLRNARYTLRKTRLAALTTGIGIMLSGAAAALWAGIKAKTGN